MTLEEIKQYLRVDSDDEDMLLQSLQIAAEEYLEGAGIAKDYEKKKYSLTVKMLIALWYENRQMTEKKMEELPFGLRCLIQQQQFKG